MLPRLTPVSLIPDLSAGGKHGNQTDWRQPRLHGAGLPDAGRSRPGDVLGPAGARRAAAAAVPVSIRVLRHRPPGGPGALEHWHLGYLARGVAAGLAEPGKPAECYPRGLPRSAPEVARARAGGLPLCRPGASAL